MARQQQQEEFLKELKTCNILILPRRGWIACGVVSTFLTSWFLLRIADPFNSIAGSQLMYVYMSMVCSDMLYEIMHTKPRRAYEYYMDLTSSQQRKMLEEFNLRVLANDGDKTIAVHEIFNKIKNNN